ncbi:MAG TPA: hypothetical protein VGC64_11220, partial [Pyrinomonadaceae bacterium]
MALASFGSRLEAGLLLTHFFNSLEEKTGGIILASFACMTTNTATFPLWQAVNSVEASPVEVRPQTDHALTQRAA